MPRADRSRVSNLPGRLIWRPDPDTRDLNRIRTKIRNRISGVFYKLDTEGALFEYNMNSAQRAETKLAGYRKEFNTHDNMHSEMCAIQATGKRPNGNGKLDGIEMSTSQPHCGYCTFMLTALGIETTYPSRGLYNLAKNYNYPIPKNLSENIDFYVNICGFQDSRDLLSHLAAAYAPDSDRTPTWREFVGKGIVRDELRPLLCRVLYVFLKDCKVRVKPLPDNSGAAPAGKKAAKRAASKPATRPARTIAKRAKKAPVRAGGGNGPKKVVRRANRAGKPAHREATKAPRRPHKKMGPVRGRQSRR